MFALKKTVACLVVLITALVPFCFYLPVCAVLAPEIFWPKIVLLSTGILLIGALQMILLIVGTLAIIVIMVAPPDY